MQPVIELLKAAPSGKRTAISSAQLRQSEVWRLRSAKFRVYYLLRLRSQVRAYTRRSEKKPSVYFRRRFPLHSSAHPCITTLGAENFSGILIKSVLRKDTFADVPDVHAANVYEITVRRYNPSLNAEDYVNLNASDTHVKRFC